MSAQYAVKKGVGVITMLNPPVNGLCHGLRDGIMKGLDHAAKDKVPAIILVGGQKNFSAGADIAEFSRGSFRQAPNLGEVIARIDENTIPVIASIHGNALGGGLETALACHYRLGCSRAKFGLPEVHLGILPGAGGTQRLPRMTGAEEAIKIITSGKFLGSKEALGLTIIDKIVGISGRAATSEEMIDAAIEFSMSAQVQNSSTMSRRISTKSVPGETSDAFFVQQLKQIEASSRGFQAPINIVKAIQAAVTSPSFDAGLAEESRLFMELFTGSQAKALQYFFFSEKKSSVLPKPASTSTSTSPTATASAAPAKSFNEIKSVGVIGGGTMGTGIAMCFANAGIPTTMIETNAELVAQTSKRIQTTYKSSSAYKSGKQSDADVAKITDLISFSSDMTALKEADLVIEAVYENMPVKQKIFNQLFQICKPTAILATNTSYLSIDEIAAGATAGTARNVLGTPNVMKLLEVIPGTNTSADTLQACLDVSKRIGKVSVLAGNCFGFIGNRMLKPYCQEALFLLEEGASPQQIDSALKQQVGMAMGPFEMMDLAGNDVSWRLRVEHNAKAAAAKENIRYTTLADKLCESGNLGQKTGHGWYSYDPKSPRKAVPSAKTDSFLASHRQAEGFTKREITNDEIVGRLLYSLVNEGFKILEEGIALRSEDIDVVYVYGYGFPRYRGGPMWWAEKEVGLAKMTAALHEYAKAHPQQPWLKPCELLTNTVQGSSTVREEVHFWQKNHKQLKSYFPSA